MATPRFQLTVMRKRNGFLSARQCASSVLESHSPSTGGYSRFVWTADPKVNASASNSRTQARAARGTPGA